jgi:4-hydroxy 2-oxovalerate aldolase
MKVPKGVTVGAPKQVQILDCTLRDGGYYNDWDYPFDLVKRYVDAMAAARIDLVELGFRTLQSDEYLGATAYTTDAFIERLNPPDSLRLAVMLNAKEIVAAGDQRSAVRSAFSRKSHSKVELVRIAANRNEVPQLSSAIDELHELGYSVALNLMQISELSLETVEQFGRDAKSYGVSWAYIADSFGALRPADVAPIMRALGEGFGANVGCHLHDNMSYALANTMEAINAGALIVDSTIQGMGRGPGNVRTEYLVMELARSGLSSARLNPLVNLVERDFAEMKRHYGWGSSLYYFQSANLSVHPTYVMELTKEDRYSPVEIVSALDRLTGKGATSFDVRRLSDAVQGEPIRLSGGMSVHDWCNARDVLVIANGPQAVAKKSEIEMFIRHHQPFVLGLNAHLPIDHSLVDAVAVCHPERAVLDSSSLAALKCEVVAPAELISSLEITLKKHRDIGMYVTGTRFETSSSGVGIPEPLVIGYALAIVTIGGAKRIFLAGIDGYPPNDSRQNSVQTTLDCYLASSNALTVTALTRTTLNVSQSSLFAPL